MNHSQILLMDTTFEMTWFAMCFSPMIYCTKVSKVVATCTIVGLCVMLWALTFYYMGVRPVT